MEALGVPSAQPPFVPLLQDRGPVDGQATVYLCVISRVRHRAQPYKHSHCLLEETEDAPLSSCCDIYIAMPARRFLG